MKYLFSFYFLLCSMGAYSQSIGTLLFAINKVVAVQQDKERSIMRGSPILIGDVIVTAINASAQIKYLNGTLISIAQNTHFQTKSYDPFSDPAVTMNMNDGTIEYNSNSKLKKRGELKTPVVTLAISGTNFQVHVTPYSTEINVKSGMVCGNGVCLGSGQNVSSGEFKTGQVFRAKDVPWVDFAREASSTFTEDLLTTQVADLTQTVEIANAVSDLNTFPALPLELAEINLTCP